MIHSSGIGDRSVQMYVTTPSIKLDGAAPRSTQRSRRQGVMGLERIARSIASWSTVGACGAAAAGAAPGTCGLPAAPLPNFLREMPVCCGLAGCGCGLAGCAAARCRRRSWCRRRCGGRRGRNRGGRRRRWFLGRQRVGFHLRRRGFPDRAGAHDHEHAQQHVHDAPGPFLRFQRQVRLDNNRIGQQGQQAADVAGDRQKIRVPGGFMAGVNEPAPAAAASSWPRRRTACPPATSAVPGPTGSDCLPEECSPPRHEN